MVLGGSPSAAAANPKTSTLYVPIQCTAAFCKTNKPAYVVDVINAAKCNVRIRSDCRVVVTARVGRSPLAVAVDERTDTVYVVNGGSNTVSVVNGARCNARVTFGCRRPNATIRVGEMPDAAAFNPATRTLYVGNLAGGSISVINAAMCNATTTRGCGRRPKTVKDNAGPAWIDIAMATDTIYAANSGTSGTGDTVSVINGSACNGHVSRGCGRAPRTVTVGGAPFGLAVDQATGAVYVPSDNDGTVSVIDGSRCNAVNSSGCRRTPATVTTGAGPQFVAVDAQLHTVFAINSGDNTLSAINTRNCNGTVTSGCAKTPPSQAAAPDHGTEYIGFPNTFALIPQTGTAYVMNFGGGNILSVTGVSRCNATNNAGCRRPAPSAPVGEFLLSADPATHTIYGGDLTKPAVDVINAASCHAGDLAGCAPVAQIPLPLPVSDVGANVGAIDETTHTLYVADPPSDKVFVINTAACNATNTAGCASALPTITIGAFPELPVINTVTKTMYIAYGGAGVANRVAVVNAAVCNATNISGCGQTPAVVDVGAGTMTLAVSAATDTIYGASAGANFDGHTVSVINGATCNGTDTAGCGHLAATIRVGTGPFGVVVDDSTHTVYVTNSGQLGDSPGTVSVINAATCNGTVTTGCSAHFPVMTTGSSPLTIVLDTHTGHLYVSNVASATVSVLNSNRCNASVTSGCVQASFQQAVGSLPAGLAISQHSVYVANTFQAGSMSIFPVTRH